MAGPISFATRLKDCPWPPRIKTALGLLGVREVGDIFERVFRSTLLKTPGIMEPGVDEIEAVLSRSLAMTLRGPAPSLSSLDLPPHVVAKLLSVGLNSVSKITMISQDKLKGIVEPEAADLVESAILNAKVTAALTARAASQLAARAASSPPAAQVALPPTANGASRLTAKATSPLAKVTSSPAANVTSLPTAKVASPPPANVMSKSAKETSSRSAKVTGELTWDTKLRDLHLYLPPQILAEFGDTSLVALYTLVLEVPDRLAEHGFPPPAVKILRRCFRQIGLVCHRPPRLTLTVTNSTVSGRCALGNENQSPSG